jgi:hypothetical protein
MKVTVLSPLGGVKGKGRRGLLPLLLALAVAGCTGPGVQPEPAQRTGAVSREEGGLHMTVETGAWHGRPANLTASVLPLRISIRNGGTLPVRIARDAFLLVGAGGQQYRPFQPTEALRYAAGLPARFPVSPAVSVYGSTVDRPDVELGLQLPMGGSAEETRDVIPAALTESVLAPGRERSGFLYFPRPEADAGPLRLLALLRELPGVPQLDFPLPAFEP